MKLFKTYLTKYLGQPGSLSQRQLAVKAEVAYPFLNRIIKGKAVPSLTVAERIAHATGRTLAEALREK